MFRSMMLVCAIGTLSAVGCVATGDTSDEAATAQDVTSHGGGSGLFDCENKASISGVQCIGSISILNGMTVNVSNVGNLDADQLSVLSGDLNNVKILDGNILDGNKILNDVDASVLNDFLNKFNIDVTKNDISVCALVGLCL
jgi:hypothetical protein